MPAKRNPGAAATATGEEFAIEADKPIANSQYSEFGSKIHLRLRAHRLRSRYGMTPAMAAVVALHAFAAGGVR